MMENDHCVATIHAEVNAIIQAAKNGIRLDSEPEKPTTLYTTVSPCWPCFKTVANVGVKRIVYGRFYKDRRIFEYAPKLGIEVLGPGQRVFRTGDLVYNWHVDQVGRIHSALDEQQWVGGVPVLHISDARQITRDPGGGFIESEVDGGRTWLESDFLHYEDVKQYPWSLALLKEILQRDGHE
jgi:tRNA(Arg) A34 adenosine deaminase TadA